MIYVSKTTDFDKSNYHCAQQKLYPVSLSNQWSIAYLGKPSSDLFCISLKNYVNMLLQSVFHIVSYF